MTNDLTKGSPFRLLLAFSVPLVIGSLFQQFYTMADAFIVGRLIGQKAFAAVGSTSAINFLIIGSLNGFAEGQCILAAQYFGAKNNAKLRKCIVNIFYVSAFATVVISALSLGFNYKIQLWLRTPTDLIFISVQYLRYIYFGIFATMLYNLSAGISRALGDSKTPLYCLILASIINIILDILFVKFFNMGVEGTAIATVLSQLLSAITCFLFLFIRCKFIHPEGHDFCFDFKISNKLISMAVPMALQISITALGSIIMQRAVNPLGTEYVAAISLASKLNDPFCALLSCVGIAIGSYTGQNIGAKKVKRVKQGVGSSLIISLVIAAIGFVVCFFGGRTLSVLFIKDITEEVIQLVDFYLKVVAVSFPFLSLIFQLRSTIQGLGYSSLAMLGGVFELIARTSVALIFIPKFGFKAACFASPVAWVAADILFVPLYAILIKKLQKKYPNELN